MPIRRLTERLAHFLALIGFTGLLVLAIMVSVDIISRALFEYPLQGVNDVAAVVMAIVISACIPQSLLVKQSIAIEVLGQAIGGRVRLGLELFASLAVLLFFSIMAWQFVPYSQSITASGEETWVLKLPVGPFWWAATACFFASVFVQILVVITDFGNLMRGYPLAPETSANQED